MPGLADWGGTNSDWSSTFATLANEQLSHIQAQADYLDQKRQARQDATDAAKFDEYNAGKLSGEELLAYIRGRIAATKYDPQQQEQWKKALLQYSQSINDNAAESQYANGGSIHNLIGYYQDKLRGLAKNTPEYADTQKRIRDLTDTAVTQDYQRGAERIQTQIALGKASYQDLLDFQRQQLSNSRTGSDVRQSIQKDIDQTRVQLQQEQFTTQMGQIQTRLQSGTIDPVEAGREQLDLLVNSGLQNSNPSQYYSMVSDAQKMINTGNDGAIQAQIDFQLQSGGITPQQAQQEYYQLAQKYQTFDPTTYYQLMTRGFNAGQTQSNTLPNQNALNGIYGPQGQVNPQSYQGPGGTFKWISQLDGTSYQDINCAAASTAMLAHVLGIDGLSGGDIRYLSHDTAGGLTLDQDAAVLKQLGAKGLTSTYSDPISFEAFKQRVLSGAPAVLSGIYGNVSSSLRVNPTLWGTHQMMIGAYDAKKDAFLVFDPAVSRNQNPNYKGEWWPASQIKNFGWGPELNGFVRYGQALFAPPNTVNEKTLKRVGGGYKFVSVDDPPQRPGTPKSYVGMHNPGNTGEAPGQHPTVTPGGNPRATVAGETNPSAQSPAGDTRPQTDAEAQKLLDANQSRIDVISELTSAYASGQTSATIGGETYNLDHATVAALNQEALHKTDWDIALNEAMGNTGAAADLRDARAKFLVTVKTGNAVPVSQLWGTLIRDANADLKLADLQTDPQKALQHIQSVLTRFQTFQKAQVSTSQVPQTGTDLNPNGVPFAPTTDLSGIDAQTQANIDAYTEALTVAADPTATADQKSTALDQLGLKKDDPGTNLIGAISAATGGIGMLESGQGMQVLHDGVVDVLPVVSRGLPDGSIIPVPDVSGFGTKDHPVDPLSLPSVVIAGPGGPQTIRAVPSQMPIGNYYQYAGSQTNAQDDTQLTNNAVTFAPGGRLSTQDIASLGPTAIQKLIAEGRLTSVPATIPVIQMPDVVTTQTHGPIRGTSPSRITKGELEFQDPVTHTWSPGIAGRMPWFVQPNTVPNAIGWDQNSSGPDFNYANPDFQPSRAYPMPLASNVSPKAVQQAITSGLLSIVTPVPVGSRDPNGVASDTPDYNAYDPQYQVWSDKARQMAGQVPPLPMSANDQNVAMDIWKAATSTSKAQYYGQDNQTFTPPTPGTPDIGQSYDPLSSLAQTAQALGLNTGTPQQKPAAVSKYTPPVPAPVQHASVPKPQGVTSPLPRIGPAPLSETAKAAMRQRQAEKTKPPVYVPPPPQKQVGNTTVVKKTTGGVGVL